MPKFDRNAQIAKYMATQGQGDYNKAGFGGASLFQTGARPLDRSDGIVTCVSACNDALQTVSDNLTSDGGDRRALACFHLCKNPEFAVAE